MAASNIVHFVGSHICKIQAIEINKSLSALSGVIEAGNVRCAVCSFRSLAVHKLGRLLAGSRSLAARLLLAGGGMFHTGLQTQVLNVCSARAPAACCCKGSQAHAAATGAADKVMQARYRDLSVRQENLMRQDAVGGSAKVLMYVRHLGTTATPALLGQELSWDRGLLLPGQIKHR